MSREGRKGRKIRPGNKGSKYLSMGTDDGGIGGVVGV